MLVVSAFVGAAVSACVTLRHFMPDAWWDVLQQPSRLRTVLVAYRQFERIPMPSEEHRIMNHEVVLKTDHESYQVIFLPRLYDDPVGVTRVRPRPGRETHVVVDRATYRVRRAYFGE